MTDLRHAWRALRAHAFFTTGVVLTLGLTIGANVAVFSLVNAVILAPLPFPNPDRLVAINQTRPDSVNEPFSIPDYRDLREGTGAFDSMAAVSQWSANLTGGEAERIQGMRASASLFPMLAVQPIAGRTLLPSDEEGSGARVVLLTHGLWMRRFGGRSDIIGAPVVLNGDTFLVAGVLPRSIVMPVRDAELIAPFPMDADARRTLRDSRFLRVLGRLKPGVTIEQARADLDAIMARLRVQFPSTNSTHLGTAVVSWRSALGALQRPVLLLLQTAVVL